MFRLKCIIFEYSTMEKTRKILSSIGTANASRGRVWWVVALMLHLFFGSSAYNDMKMMLVVKLYPIIFWTARRLLLRIFHLLVMNMIPLRIRLHCIFFISNIELIKQKLFNNNGFIYESIIFIANMIFKKSNQDYIEAPNNSIDYRKIS